MPRDYATRLTAEQIDIIVNYLLDLTGEEADVTVIGEGGDGTDGAPAPKAFPAPKMVGGESQKSTAVLAVQILLLTLVFLLSLFRLLKQPPSED
jgi:hypothetical protein